MSTPYSLAAGLCWALLLLLGGPPARGQALPPVLPHRTCATQAADERQQARLKRLLPGYNAAKSRATTPLYQRTAATTYVLPVVVHLVHSDEAVGTGTNLSQAQVQSQLDVLNEDYRNLNADGAQVPSAFQPVRADVQVQFVAALRDPSGNLLPEPGIDRVSRAAKGFAAPPYSSSYIDDTIKPATDWNPDQYVNIWVLNLDGNLLGYAQFPDNTANLGGLSPLGGAAATDGVVILYSAFGRVGTLSTNYNKGRTLTHELGHWLGLRHVWGDQDCGDDYCADTPTQQTSNLNCPAFPHVSCSNGASGDMFMNYMDYVDDACMHLFSGDQKDRIQAVMAAGTPRRTVLLASPALCASLVAATASSSGAVCPGGTVRLAATGPAGAAYAWAGPGGYTSTQQNPVLANLTAAQAGTYTVTVTVTTGACPGTASTAVVVPPVPPVPVLATSAATVCPGSAATLTATNLAPGPLLREDFNGAAPGWTLATAGLASTAWQYQAAPFSYADPFLSLLNYSLDGSRFVLANSDAGGTGSVTNTTLTSPAFSTVGYGGLSISFQHYYQHSSGDLATVEASLDGGATWATVATYSADQGTAATPATATLSLAAYAGQPRVQLRWRYVGSWGYVWALDNVRLSGTAQPLAYAWSLVSGDGLPAATNTASLLVSPTQPSVYRLSVSYAGAGCPAASVVSVGIGEGAGAVAASSSEAVCSGGTVRLTATGPAGTTYTWTGPNGYLSTEQNPVLTNLAAAQAGTYTVAGRTSSTACPPVASTTVALLAGPPVPVLASSLPSVCPGTAAVLTATNLAGLPAPPSYTWSLVSGDGLPAATNTASLVVSPTQPSVYRLSVSYAGAACPATATIALDAAAPVWTGAAGTGDWFDAGNWAGCVPTRAYDALIPAGLSTPYPVIAGGTAEVRTLTQAGGLTLAGGELALYGDYAGAGPLTQTGGTVATRGPGAQSLRAGTYLALLVGGTGTKTIGAATIGQRLLLSGALLSTGSAVLTLAPTATLTETEASYVLGQVQTTHLVNTTTDDFGGLGLSLTPSSAPGRTTVVRTTGPAPGAASPSISLYFDVAATFNRNLGASLSLSYFQHELNGLAERALTLYKSTDAGATWRAQGASGRATTTVTLAGVDDLQGRWTLATAAAPLPVALLDFAATQAGPTAVLTWTTTTEKPDASFLLDYSLDGEAYHPVTTLAGTGTGRGPQAYRVVDAQLLAYAARVVYYRLQQLDRDGGLQVAPVRQLTVANAVDLAATATPVPFDAAGVTVEVTTAQAGPLSLKLYDILGRVVASQVAPVGVGTTGLPLLGSGQLPPGKYILLVEQAGRRVRLAIGHQ